jgi:hypothetical protein
MNKRELLIKQYAEHIRSKFGQEPDLSFLKKVTIGLGPSIYKNDASKVSGSDQTELERVKHNFLIAKLGLEDGPDLMQSINEVMEQYGASVRNKHRAVIYYMLARRFNKEAVYQ